MKLFWFHSFFSFLNSTKTDNSLHNVDISIFSSSVISLIIDWPKNIVELISLFIWYTNNSFPNISANNVIKWVLPEFVFPCNIMEQSDKIEQDKNNKQCFWGLVKVLYFLSISSLLICLFFFNGNSKLSIITLSFSSFSSISILKLLSLVYENFGTKLKALNCNLLIISWILSLSVCLYTKINWEITDISNLEYVLSLKEINLLISFNDNGLLFDDV